jgi:hypothetical protein
VNVNFYQKAVSDHGGQIFVSGSKKNRKIIMLNAAIPQLIVHLYRIIRQAGDFQPFNKGKSQLRARVRPNSTAGFFLFRAVAFGSVHHLLPVFLPVFNPVYFLLRKK